MYLVESAGGGTEERGDAAAGELFAGGKGEIQPSRPTLKLVILTSKGGIQMAQTNWRFCRKCQGLFWGGLAGVCAAGGTHDSSASANYELQDQAGDPGQHNWRWCHKCSGLFFAGNPTTGWCPAGGGHEHMPSSDYSLQDAGQSQTDWRWCHKCQGLFFGANPSSGACPSGGGHDYTGSDNYHLLIVT